LKGVRADLVSKLAEVQAEAKAAAPRGSKSKA